MDDMTRAWVPELRADGTVEVAVNHSDTTTGRRSLESVSVERYVEIWQKGALNFQEDGKPKPEHLPTLEQAQAYLDRCANGEIVHRRVRFLTDKAHRAYHDLRLAVAHTTDDAITHKPSAVPNEPAPPKPTENDMVQTNTSAPEDNLIDECKRAVTLLVSSDPPQNPSAEAVAGLLSRPVDEIAELLVSNPEVFKVNLKASDTDDEKDDADTTEEDEGSQSTGRRGLSPERFRELMAQSRANGSRTNYLDKFPALDETTTKFAALSETQRAAIRDYAASDWTSHRDRHAMALGVPSGKVVIRIKEILRSDLGIVETMKVTKYLRKMLGKYDKNPQKYTPSAALEAVNESSVQDTNGHEASTPHVNGNGHHQELVAKEPLVPASTDQPSMVMRPYDGGGFLIQPPPGTKEITITIKF